MYKSRENSKITHIPPRLTIINGFKYLSHLFSLAIEIIDSNMSSLKTSIYSHISKRMRIFSDITIIPYFPNASQFEPLF